MTIFQALILSVVEGITEFLPVSSTGHLILTSSILQISQTEFIKSFEIFIQLGAILSVVVLYFSKLFQHKNYLKPLLVAFVPSAVLGLILYKFVKTILLGNSLVVVVSLFLGGLLLLVFERFTSPKISHKTIETLSLQDSIIIGIMQAVSIIPGVSRSAATIIGGLTVGLSRSQAVEFSFLLAIPTILAATVLDLVKSNLVFTPDSLLIFLVGFAGSFFTALISVRFFLIFVQNRSLRVFGIYRIIVALFFFFYFLR